MTFINSKKDTLNKEKRLTEKELCKKHKLKFKPKWIIFQLFLVLKIYKHQDKMFRDQIKNLTHVNKNNKKYLKWMINKFQMSNNYNNSKKRYKINNHDYDYGFVI